jgi:plasmid maintenance system antidote protein VapI
MNFRDLQVRLTEHLRECVRSGRLTERGLARMTGVSQPHIHNVLKGKKLLSVPMADEILRRLEVDVEDLLGQGRLDPPSRQV